jgi:hypothetical protein
MNLQTRIAIEKRIARKLVSAIIAGGFVISVFDGEDYPVKKSANVKDVMAGMFGVDEEHILIRRPLDGGLIGSVFLVYGNDGFDVICDYSVSLEELIRPALDYAKEQERKYG